MKVRNSAFAAFAATAIITASASAATLVDFKPVPALPNAPEFSFDGTSLNEDAGSQSNGDGTLAPTNQTAPGLNFDVPLIIPGVAGSTVNATSGTTTFFDGSIQLTGFAASAPAGTNFGTFAQQLGVGGFELRSTPTVSFPTGELLLSGTVANSVIFGGGSAGAAFSVSENVTYTGGLIYNQLVAFGGTLSGNDFSFSFVNVSPSFSIPSPGGNLAPFTTDATGLFNVDAVPEPSVAGVLAIGGLLAAARRRRV